MGRLLVARGIGLVYGGGNVGLMGAIADAVVGAGGESIGVIPRRLQAKELAHAGLTELRVVETMHERKAMMADLSDAFIAMPGGMGTLEELFEVATWLQLGIHDKPLGLLNVRGYYEGLRAFLDHAIAERFLRPEHRSLVAFAETPEALLEALESFAPAPAEKWLDRAER